MWGAGWGYWGLGWWFWLFWLLLIVLVIFALPWGGRIRSVRPEERILRERYARGEISREEFERRMRDLRRAA